MIFYSIPDQTEVRCNFEDNLCTLANVTSQKDQWLMAAAADQIIDKDNTLSSGETRTWSAFTCQLDANTRSLYSN
jgi:hypothetical protein